MEINVNGVEILAAQEVAIEYNFNSTVFWIIFGVVCSIFIIAGICESIKYCNWIHLIDMVGWKDTENDVYYDYNTEENKPLKLNGNYFVYIGDSNCTLAFYKEQIVIVRRYNDGTFSYNHEYFNCTNYTWSKWKNMLV